MTTTLKHPDSPNPIEVESDRVALYRSQGWAEVVKPKSKPKADDKPE